MSEKMVKEEKLRQATESDAVYEALIDKLEANPVLYDRDREDFKNIKLKNALVAKFAEELHITPKDAENRIKYLRDNFTKEKNLMQKESMSGAGSSKRKQFRFYHQMCFIEPFIRKRGSICTLSDSTEESVEEIQEAVKETAEVLFDELCDVIGLDEVLDDPNPATKEAVEEILTLERLLSDDVEKTDNAVKTLFPSTAVLEKSPRKRPSTMPVQEIKSIKVVAKVEEKKSSPLSPALPILGSAKPDIKSKRAKTKREAEVTESITSMLGALQKSLEVPAATSGEQSEEDMLCSQIAVALKGVQDARKRLGWRRKFQRLLDELEDETLADQEAACSNV